jgi:hypothetical protein
MAGVEDYPRLVEEIIRRYGQYKPSYGEVEVQMVFDRENHHYHLLNVGWHNYHRIRGCVLHIDIKDDQIWIQHDGTESGVANDLVAMGIPKEDIVLAFHAPYKHPYTGFGVGK